MGEGARDVVGFRFIRTECVNYYRVRVTSSLAKSSFPSSLLAVVAVAEEEVGNSAKIGGNVANSCCLTFPRSTEPTNISVEGSLNPCCSP